MFSVIAGSSSPGASKISPQTPPPRETATSQGLKEPGPSPEEAATRRRRHLSCRPLAPPLPGRNGSSAEQPHCFAAGQHPRPHPDGGLRIRGNQKTCGLGTLHGGFSEFSRGHGESPSSPASKMSQSWRARGRRGGQ